MKTRRVAVSAGKAAEFNADGNGYAPSGEGQFSRIAAHGRVSPQMLRATPARLDKGNELSTPNLIREYTGRIRWLEAQLRIEDDPKRTATIRKNLEIKHRRLTELRRAAS
jgi:hypothetical protein